MTDTAVQVENLSKRYQIGGQKSSYNTLRDSIASMAQDTIQKLRWRGTPNSRRDFWALKDLSFSVNRGEVVGIIGRNGAGKSTLLKILSRVTYPTKGRAEVCGRVGSLLEVGTGFHPELTGRENIYLNGTVLGMKRAEIDRKFDEIIDFAEIDQFLDTPVKRYSSGMYMRLAFSIAAHLEPDILIVDEVLAVGDTAFQKKCLGKMQDVAKSDGRTILFVSHNMEAIKRLCSRCLLLEGGRLTHIGDTPTVVARYLSQLTSPFESQPDIWIDLSRSKRSGNGEVRFMGVKYSSCNGALSGQPYSTGPLEFTLELESNRSRDLRSLAVNISDVSGNRLINADSVLLDRAIFLQPGRNQVRLRIDQLYLNPGQYKVGLWAADPIRTHLDDLPYDFIESAFDIEVVNPARRGNGLKENAIVACDFDLMVVS